MKSTFSSYSERLMCRICLDQDHRLQMISPCNCKGTSEYVHKSCLSKWRSIDGASRFRCEICQSHYRFCRSWAKAGLIRLGCWAAILMYGYLMLFMSQWAISWLGLHPQMSRISKFNFDSQFLPLFDSFFKHVTIGPMTLLISPCVSIKKNKTDVITSLKSLSFWALTFYLSFMSQRIALISDFLYISLTAYGAFRTLQLSFSNQIINCSNSSSSGANSQRSTCGSASPSTWRLDHIRSLYKLSFLSLLMSIWQFRKCGIAWLLLHISRNNVCASREM